MVFVVRFAVSEKAHDDSTNTHEGFRVVEVRRKRRRRRRERACDHPLGVAFSSGGFDFMVMGFGREVVWQ